MPLVSMVHAKLVTVGVRELVQTDKEGSALCSHGTEICT